MKPPGWNFLLCIGLSGMAGLVIGLVLRPPVPVHSLVTTPPKNIEQVLPPSSELLALKQQLEAKDERIAALADRVEEQEWAKLTDTGMEPNPPEVSATRAALESEQLVALAEQAQQLIESIDVQDLPDLTRSMSPWSTMSDMYGSLARKLDIDPEVDIELRQAMQQKALIQATAMIPVLKGQAPKNRQKEMDEIESQIQSLLGWEKYAVYRNYQDTSQARWEVGQFQASLQSTSWPLDDAQQEAMVELFDHHGIRSEPNQTLFTQILAVPDPAETLERSLDGAQGQYQAILDDAGEVLFEEQLVGLEEFLNHQIHQREAQAGIAAGILPLLHATREQRTGGSR